MIDSTRTLEIAGRRVEVLDLPGDDSTPPIVLLHEGLGSIELWRRFPTDLHAATGRRLIAFSRHGHGRSEQPPVPRTPEFFHTEALHVLPELFAQLAIRTPVLLGHSDGASIAVIHAAHHPVDRLVLVAPHVFVEQIAVDAIRQTRERYLSGSLSEKMSRYHDDADAAFWAWCNVWLDPDFLRWELAEETALLTVPTLLIQGSEDPYGTLEQLDRIEQATKSARRLILPGGHSPHLKHGPQVVEAIGGFLAAN